MFFGICNQRCVSNYNWKYFFDSFSHSFWCCARKFSHIIRKLNLSGINHSSHTTYTVMKVSLKFHCIQKLYEFFDLPLCVTFRNTFYINCPFHTGISGKLTQFHECTRHKRISFSTWFFDTFSLLHFTTSIGSFDCVRSMNRKILCTHKINWILNMLLNVAQITLDCFLYLYQNQFAEDFDGQIFMEGF